MASDKLSFIEFDDIEDQLKDIFTGSEIISLTSMYAGELGKKVPINEVKFNSKKKIITANLGILSVNEKIDFL